MFHLIFHGKELRKSNRPNSKMPPKVARRKKQLKEQISSSEVTAVRKGDGGDEDEYDEDDDTPQEAEKHTTTISRTSKVASSGAAAVSNNTMDEQTIPVTPEDDRVWVQCNTCDKWRALPSSVDPALLPDIWYCELNIYDISRNCCEV